MKANIALPGDSEPCDLVLRLTASNKREREFLDHIYSLLLVGNTTSSYKYQLTTTIMREGFTHWKTKAKITRAEVRRTEK